MAAFEVARRLVNGVWRTGLVNEDQNGGSQPWEIVRVPLAYNTADILTGLTVYTPTAGDYVLSATMSITEAWDGTTPQGWLYAAGDDPESVNWINQDMTSEDQENKTGWLEPPDINFPAPNNAFGAAISDGTAAIKFIVTDGAAGNPGSSQGAGELILFIVKAS